jgi:hypothetical protein
MDVRRLALCSLALALIAPVLPAAAAVDKCLTGASAGQDRVDILAVRGDVEATCPCDAATSHPSYVACARGVVSGLTLRNKCLGTVIRIEKRVTVDIPSPAEPTHTPGSPGVVVTNPKLLAQFGGGTFDLNNARYTRFRAHRPGLKPDLVLILIPGFEGGPWTSRSWPRT